MTLGKGRAEAITNNDIASLATEVGCHPATLEAIAEVESNGFGWFDDGRIKILPEPHKFHEYLPAGKRAAALKAGLATTSYAQTKASGHYKKMTNSPGPRYDMLAKWIEIDADAAFKSISVGKFQIMGFNAATCGFSGARAMFDAFVDSEVNQLRAFGRFLIKNGLRTALKQENFARVEEVYNGGGLNGAYAKRMKAESDKLKRGKWAKWPVTWPGKNEARAPVVEPKPAAVDPKPVPVVAPTPAPGTPAPVPANDNKPGFWARLFASFRKASNG
jgi:hypothetical protein